MNLVGATVEDDTARFAGFEVALPPGLWALNGREVVLGIRPPDLEDADVSSGRGLPTIEVTAEVTEELGSEVNVLFTVEAPPVETEDTLAATEEGSDEIGILAGERQAVFCARVDARTSCRPGDHIRLSVDPRRFHFFDPQTGLALSPSPAVVAST
jgi:multiple sugar transport system ATP-binding protein